MHAATDSCFQLQSFSSGHAGCCLSGVLAVLSDSAALLLLLLPSRSRSCLL